MILIYKTLHSYPSFCKWPVQHLFVRDYKVQHILHFTWKLYCKCLLKHDLFIQKEAEREKTRWRIATWTSCTLLPYLIWKWWNKRQTTDVHAMALIMQMNKLLYTAPSMIACCTVTVFTMNTWKNFHTACRIACPPLGNVSGTVFSTFTRKVTWKRIKR